MAPKFDLGGARSSAGVLSAALQFGFGTSLGKLSIKLGQYRGLFKKKSIDGPALLAMAEKEESLTKFGIKELNAQTHLLQSINNLPRDDAREDRSKYSMLSWTGREVTDVSMHSVSVLSFVTVTKPLPIRSRSLCLNIVVSDLASGCKTTSWTPWWTSLLPAGWKLMAFASVPSTTTA